MLRKPPHILVTTPESLYLLLTGAKSREMLRNVRTVIVDEIHALARDKRGSHLALSLARLDRLVRARRRRAIGLSATQRPIDEIARFLVGHAQCGRATASRSATSSTPATSASWIWRSKCRRASCRPCAPSKSGRKSTRGSAELIREHRSTLVFVNTRRLAERVCHYLEEQLGAGHVASHHGSLSREMRLRAEEQLKAAS